MKTYTRYNNLVLFDKCQSLCPYPIAKGMGFNHWTDAATYLEQIISKGDPLAINIDQDCFITDASVLSELIEAFKQGGFTHAGVSDGGVISHRKNISWAVMNPFFNLFAPERIMEADPDWADIRDYGFRPEMNERKPSHIPEYEKSQWEPFNGLFNWMFNHGHPLWLGAEEHPDGISTILTYLDRPFALHTWYSRQYGADATQTRRIDERFKEAVELNRRR